MTCALCALTLPLNPPREGEHAFCCSGCLTVHRILGAVENYREHPLFQEALKAGVIGNPHLTDEETAPAEEEVKCHVQVEGMWCPSCAEAIRLILMRRKGMVRCVIDYATDLGVVIFNPRILSKEHVLASITQMGYQATEFNASEKRIISRKLWVRFAVAAFCALNIMMFSYPLYTAHFGIPVDGYELTFGWLSFALALPLVTYAAWPIWKRLIVSFRSGLFGMETLVLLGVSTAFGVSTYHLIQEDPAHIYFDSMSMVLSLVLLGKILEKKAKFSAKETLLRLARCVPKKGCKRLDSGEYAYVPLKEIVCGDTLIVRTGEKVPLDGTVIEGSALVDEAVMNGEARPIRKIPGRLIIGGSIVKQGHVVFTVTKDQAGSLLGQILHTIEHDLPTRQIPEQLVDTITRFFIPSVLLIALATCLFAGPIQALIVLLISCPCTIGIAIPLAQSRLLFLFAEQGALVRNRSRIFSLARNPLFAFDKTGTLTEGKFELITGLETLSHDHAAILKGIASQSTHPICTALCEAIQIPQIPIEANEIVGRGMLSDHLGNVYLLGSERLMQEKGLQVPSYPETTVYFAENNTLVATLHFGDRLRPHIPSVDAVILSGDSHALVEKIASSCGFRWGKGGLDPLQKREEILALKQTNRPVIMVGDGVNDAPAMSAADLSISVVSATDLAIEVSDILLTTENLSALPRLISLTRTCRRIIHQNLFWAFIYNVIGIAFAIFGLLTPLLAALAMTLSSLFVTLNTLRLRSKQG